MRNQTNYNNLSLGFNQPYILHVRDLVSLELFLATLPIEGTLVMDPSGDLKNPNRSTSA